MLVCRNTGLDDRRHVEVSRLFGELDDVKPYNSLGRKNRLAYDEYAPSSVASCGPEGQII